MDGWFFDGNYYTRVNNLSLANKYIQSATLNGKPWDKGWFRHQDIAQGAELVLEMGATPSAWGTKAEPPPSVSQVEKQVAGKAQ